MRYLCLILAVLSSSVWADPFGKWNTIDDSTGKVRSEVTVFEKDNKMYAVIDNLTDPSVPNPPCDKCKGELKGQPIIGMTIIDGLKKHGDKWKGGEILDPESGKTYKVKVWEEDGKLMVRGYIGFLFRTQEWVRPASN